MIAERASRVYGFASDAYWLDLGTPEKYRQAHFDMIEGKVHDVSYPAPWVAEGAEVDLRAHLGRWVAVGGGASIGPEAEVDDSVLLPGAARGRRARRCCARSSAPGARVGAGAILVDSVLGEDARRARRDVAHGRAGARRHRRRGGLSVRRADTGRDGDDGIASGPG